MGWMGEELDRNLASRDGVDSGFCIGRAAWSGACVPCGVVCRAGPGVGRQVLLLPTPRSPCLHACLASRTPLAAGAARYTRVGSRLRRVRSR